MAAACRGTARESNGPGRAGRDGQRFGPNPPVESRAPGRGPRRAFSWLGGCAGRGTDSSLGALPFYVTYEVAPVPIATS